MWWAAGRPGGYVCAAFCFVGWCCHVPLVSADWGTVPCTSTNTSSANASTVNSLSREGPYCSGVGLDRCNKTHLAQQDILEVIEIQRASSSMPYRNTYRYGVTAIFTVVRACFGRVSRDCSASQGGQHLSITGVVASRPR